MASLAERHTILLRSRYEGSLTGNTGESQTVGEYEELPTTGNLNKAVGKTIQQEEANKINVSPKRSAGTTHLQDYQTSNEKQKTKIKSQT